jgi:periplasmic protein TonB
MEPKKNPAKDIHRFSKHFFLIGLSVSISVIIVALESSTRMVARPHPPEPPIDVTFLSYDVPYLLVEQLEKPAQPNEIRIIDPSRVTDSPEEISQPDNLVVEPPALEISGPIVIVEPDEAPPVVFVIVEKMPEPIGGFGSFYKRLSNTIKYPKQAIRNRTEGKVIVEFIIDPSGEPVDFKILLGIGSGCDEEAIRVLKLVKWEPGKQRGRPVPVKKVLPVYFMLN